MYRRHIVQFLETALSDTPVVLLNGARQTGKSTLALQSCWENSGNKPVGPAIRFHCSTIVRRPDGRSISSLKISKDNWLVWKLKHPKPSAKKILPASKPLQKIPARILSGVFSYTEGKKWCRLVIVSGRGRSVHSGNSPHPNTA